MILLPFLVGVAILVIQASASEHSKIFAGKIVEYRRDNKDEAAIIIYKTSEDIDKYNKSNSTTNISNM